MMYTISRALIGFVSSVITVNRARPNCIYLQFVVGTPLSGKGAATQNVTRDEAKFDT